MNSSSGKISDHQLSSANSQTASQQNFLNLTANDNFKVVVRVRPPLQREVQDGRFISTVQVSPDHSKICLYEYFNLDLVDHDSLEDYLSNPNSYTMHTFSFDYVYDQDNTQEHVYQNTAKQAVMSTLEGFNATIMAYGQTGTGKTFTMEGFKYNCVDPQRGIVPRSVEEIFKYIQNSSNQKTTFMVRISYLQIYNEVISDLLKTDRNNLHIREDKKRGVFVEGLSEWAVRNPTEIYQLIQKGASSRATASTKMNDVSSRSHAVFIIIIEQMYVEDDDDDKSKYIKVGKLNLVDLAGSERVRVTGATGKRLEECKKINQSLSCLGNVISALTDPKGHKSHIPYRDSKITRLLEDSLGGNCKTTMMSMISPAVDSFQETLSSVKFANRAKNIKNLAVINEDVDQKALLRKYEFELQRLRKELLERNKMNVDKSKLTQLEEDKRKAEQDKNAAMAALEARSKQFFLEREEKKKLEEKIRQIQQQMLVGGHSLENTPQFRSALEEQQKIIREQYDKKMSELEKERQQLEEDKVQVDRYKQLLLKQRDIMIALTTRLNERDETIIQLQDELDAYDRIHRETEIMLEERQQRAQQLEELINNSGINLPSGLKGQSNINQSQQKSKENNTQALYNDERQFQELKLLNQEQEKDILLLQQQMDNQRQERTSQFLDYTMQVKNSIDNIVEALSQPNDGSKLQTVAKDLINLQKIVTQQAAQLDPGEPLFEQEVDQVEQPYVGLNNIQNLVYNNNEDQKQISNFYTFSQNQFAKLNSQSSSSKKQPPQQKGNINVEEILKMREMKRNAQKI